MYLTHWPLGVRLDTFYSVYSSAGQFYSSTGSILGSFRCQCVYFEDYRLEWFSFRKYMQFCNKDVVFGFCCPANHMKIQTWQGSFKAAIFSKIQELWVILPTKFHRHYRVAWIIWQWCETIKYFTLELSWICCCTCIQLVVKKNHFMGVVNK